MIFKNTWLWITVAAGLFALSFFHYEQTRKAPAGPPRILPQITSAEITNVQVHIGPQVAIRAEQSNGVWQLSEPLQYPAERPRIEKLLEALEHLTPALYISRRELMERPNGEEEYGFGAPQATIILKQYGKQIYIGARTAPGNQVFLQVVGDEGIYVVDAELLKFVPQKAEDWRDTRLLDLKDLAFDRVAVTNGGNGFELQKDETDGLWRIVTSDVSARAETSRIEEFLKNVGGLRVAQFVSDSSKADLDAYGLQNPEFQLAFGRGTNPVAMLQFGKSLTNDSKQVFARRAGRNAILAVDRQGLSPWPTSANFRDVHLVSHAETVEEIQVQGEDTFSLRMTNGAWRVLPQDFPADSLGVKDLLTLVGRMQIVEFVKDMVPPPFLSNYALAHPALEYVLRSGGTNDAAPGTNDSTIGLQFGGKQEDKVYVRRTDESSVYAVKLDDYDHLGRASWQFRDRRIWKFPIDDLAGVTIQQAGKARQLVRNGDHRWSLAPGSQGTIEGLAVEETLLDLVDLSARAWIARGGQHLAALGFNEAGQKITLEFKNGDKRTIEMSTQTPLENGLAAVSLDGEPWIFTIRGDLRRDVVSFLSIPKEFL